MSAKRILIVDDEVALSAVLAEVVSDMGHKPTVVNDGAAGLAEAIKGGYDLAILDLSLPKVSGLEILRKLKELWPETLAIMVTAYASMRGAVEALSLGAYDYLTKPFDVEEVRMIVERALERTRLLDENRYLLEQLQQQFNFSNVIGYDRKVQEAYVMAAKVADSNASVLILGETGG